MTIYETSLPNTLTVLEDLVTNKKEGLIVEFTENLWLATGTTENTYSEDIQRELGLSVIPFKYNGGTCVLFPGDLSFVEFKYGNSDFSTRIMSSIENFLKEKNLRVMQRGNDLLLLDIEDRDFFKVASYGSGWLDKEYKQSVVHVSIGMDEDLVSKVCTKPCEKKPRGLSKYGITAQDIYNALKVDLHSIT